MKKKIFLVGFVVVAIIALATTSWAAWVNSVYVQTEAKEPIVYSLVGNQPIRETIYPGETFSFVVEAKNLASVAYGLRYTAWVNWAYHDGEMGGAGVAGVAGKKINITVEEKSTGELTGTIAAGGTPYSIGKISFVIDPDGPDGPLPLQAYKAWEVVNIAAQGEHLLQVSVTLNSDLYVGNLEVGVTVFREKPL